MSETPKFFLNWILIHKVTINDIKYAFKRCSILMQNQIELDFSATFFGLGTILDCMYNKLRKLISIFWLSLEHKILYVLVTNARIVNLIICSISIFTSYVMSKIKKFLLENLLHEILIVLNNFPKVHLILLTKYSDY